MADYREVFPNPHTVLPVVHVETQKQTFQNLEIAQREGADGAFLISMQGMSHSDLARVHLSAKKEFGPWWIGVNYLDLPASNTFAHAQGVSGIWIDNAQIDEKNEIQVSAYEIEASRKKSGWKGLYFGGVAFKYQTPVTDIERAAKIATKYMDVVTTSGSGTASAPDRDKIARMKGAIGEFPLAIASGISPDNVHDYLDVADCFLVASSLLEPNREVFIPSLVRDLVQATRA